MKTIPLAAALLLPLALAAQPAPLLNIDDPEGDDNGGGALVYPGDSAYAPGDLDLRSLRAFAEPAGIRFEATFRNPIRHPSTVHPPGPSSEDLSAFARRGFYEFNLDLYLDTDRVPGSGNTLTLPGRGATIAAADAWDKAIVLTPRPELMRRQLIDALAGVAGSDAAAEQQVDHSVYFATDVRVRGRTVSFTVPNAVIDAPTLARSSLVAVVTAAKLSVETDLNVFGRFGGPSGLALGAAVPEAGRPRLTMGYSGAAPASAIVDLLQPDPAQQARQLGAGAELAGLNADNRYGALPSPPPAAAAGIAAADPLAAAFARSLAALLHGQSIAAAPAAVPPAPAAAPAAAPPAAPPPAAAVAPVAPLPAAPAAAAAPKALRAPLAAPTAGPAPQAAPARQRDAAFYEEQEQRLRALKRLRDGGLITEDEYQKKRREVLDQL